MSSIHAPFVSISLTRLKRGVVLCCWVVGVSLVTQIMIWGVASFMDVRYEVRSDTTAAPLVIAGSDSSRQTPSSIAENVDKPVRDAVDPNRVPTEQDYLMAKASKFAYGAGMIGILLLIPLMGLGTMLGASSCTPGVEKLVAGFMWTLLVSVMILPLGHVFDLPWRDGALVSYTEMTRQVELQMTGSADSWGTPTFYARYAILPLACVVGLTIIGMGFSAGVHAGIIREDLKLDPNLEKEASNVTPSSLHGGRAAVALRTASVAAAAERKVAAVGAPAPPSITQLSPGEAPRRLI